MTYPRTGHPDLPSLHAYLDDELESDGRAGLEDHLLTCDGCTAELTRLRGLFATIESLPDVQPSRDLATGVLAQMGQPLFCWPTPDGGHDTTEAWDNNLLPRWKFALSLALSDIPGAALPWVELRQQNESDGVWLDRMSALLLGGVFPEPQRRELLAGLGEGKEGDEAEMGAASMLVIASMLTSPAFQWR